MPYIHFTEDQKLRANSVDLVEFLRRQGEKLISSGQDKRLTSDHSITVHGNEWYDHAAERGGHAISFVQNFYGLTYPYPGREKRGGQRMAGAGHLLCQGAGQVRGRRDQTAAERGKDPEGS